MNNNDIWEENLKQLLSSSYQEVKPSPAVKERIYQELMQGLKPHKARYSINLWKWVSLSAAAVLLLAFVSTLVLRKNNKPVTPPLNNIQEYNMADGSQIINFTGSAITIKESDRQVILAREGRLFLQVTPSNKQFSLITPAGTVYVLGTEFLVRLEKGKSSMSTGKWIITVLVVSGVVQLINSCGAIIGKTGETISSEEDSAPKKQVQ
ncbi:MAG: FecR family protein, partial [Planctomycetota bacterium]